VGHGTLQPSDQRDPSFLALFAAGLLQFRPARSAQTRGPFLGAGAGKTPERQAHLHGSQTLAETPAAVTRDGTTIAIHFETLRVVALTTAATRPTETVSVRFTHPTAVIAALLPLLLFGRMEFRKQALEALFTVTIVTTLRWLQWSMQCFTPASRRRRLFGSRRLLLHGNEQTEQHGQQKGGHEAWA